MPIEKDREAYEQALRDLAAFVELQRQTVLQECGEMV